MKIKLIILSSTVVFSVLFPVTSEASDQDFVKKSNNGYCHYVTSPFFDRTRRYTRYETLSECLDADGQMPPTNVDYETDSLVKFSRSRICHTVDSPYYEQTRRYVAFDSLEDCVKHGGRE